MMERLLITRIGRRGDGIAETPAGPLYVPYALPGELIEADAWSGHGDRRHLIKVDVASAQRIAPVCAHFGTCGGCALQHWRTADYRSWKRALAVDALTQAGLDAPVDALADAHGDGRRRAVFHARLGARGLIEVGFAALRSHQVVAIDRCPVLASGLAGAIEAARAIAQTLARERKPLDIQVTATDAGLDIDVRGSGPLTAACAMELAQLAERHRLARLTRHGELLMQRTVPTISMGRARVALPPGAFLQATAAGEAALAALVVSHCRGEDKIADLFAGIGPFALRLAERARVTAIDNDARAIAALKNAAATTPGLRPVETQRRDLFRAPLARAELERFKAVVFDPPRQGAEAQARELATTTVPAVIAVSCNPLTFARDARILIDGGYRMLSVTPVDQFLYSPHLELVARFEKVHHRVRRTGPRL